MAQIEMHWWSLNLRLIWRYLWLLLLAIGGRFRAAGVLESGREVPAMKTLADRFRAWYEHERDCNAKIVAMLASVPAERRSEPELRRRWAAPRT